MSDQPLLVTSSSAVAGILSGGILLGTLLLGGFGTLVLFALLGVQPVWLAAVLGFGGVGGGLSYLSYKGAQGSEVRFFEEGFEAEANTGEGADFSAFSDTKRRYEGIDLVLRDDELGDRLFGTGTFKLVAPGTGTIRMPYLEQPDRVQRILTERVPQPRELRRRAERDELDRDSHLWTYWAGDRVPDDPVVDADEFGEMAELDVADADTDAVMELGDLSDEAGFDSSDVSGMSSVDGVDAGAFDGGGAGGGGDAGGGFGGGDGGGGGGGE